jgi:hypothetical protein
MKLTNSGWTPDRSQRVRPVDGLEAASHLAGVGLLAGALAVAQAFAGTLTTTRAYEHPILSIRSGGPA